MLNLNIFVKFVKHCTFYHGIAVATFLSVALFRASHMYALRTYFFLCVRGLFIWGKVIFVSGKDISTSQIILFCS